MTLHPHAVSGLRVLAGGAFFLLVAFAIIQAPAASAVIGGKLCLKSPIYISILPVFDELNCRRWVCIAPLQNGAVSSDHFCQGLKIYPYEKQVYARGVLTPNVDLENFRIVVTMQDLSRFNEPIPDCVWEQSDIAAGTRVVLDSCFRVGPYTNGGPWIFNTRFEAEPQNPEELTLAWGYFTGYYAEHPQKACVYSYVHGDYQCVDVPK